MDHVSGSVVARFPQPDAGGALSIEPDVGIYGDSDVHLLLYPAEPGILVRASEGEVIVGDVKPVTMPSGIVQFSGSSSASLPRPARPAPEFKVQYAADAEGNEVSIRLSYDGNLNVLQADRDCYAAVSYTSYQTAARRLAYRPARSMLPAGGLSLRFGAIFAVKPGKPPRIFVYEVQPFSIINGNAVFELYRIVSDVITTQTGEHEKPPAYPTNGNYPDRPALDISVNLQTERVHEIGYMDEAGRGWVNSYFVSAVDPYVGDNAYVIQKRAKVASISQFPRNLQLKALDFIASRGLGVRDGG